MISLSLVFAAVLATNSVAKTGSLAHITSDTTYYDRKEGIVVFKGHVHVDDSEYQMHARRAYVFTSVSNTLENIVAMGAVALTNGTKRAYGEKATFHRGNGLVVLSGTPEAAAIVQEETSSGLRSVRGRKIRFWINREQVEVLEADLTTPQTGGGSLGLPL